MKTKSLPLNLASPAARRSWIDQILALDRADEVYDTQWEQLARTLFAWQFAQVKPYRKLCLAREVTPKNLARWPDIPAAPQLLFKKADLFAPAAKKPGVIYETSGTTTGQPGRQFLLEPTIYRAVAAAGVPPELLAAAPRFFSLTPAPTAAPHSSLSAMFGFWADALNQSHAECFQVRHDQIDFPRLRAELLQHIAAEPSRPVALVGTAFSFVHLLDAWENEPPLALPSGSWLLETGGFKGRSREIPKADLYAALAAKFAVPEENIWNEYGMSELSSQAYARGADGWHDLPPWARVRIIDPATNAEVPIGERGLVQWFDLANVDSVGALQTLDLAERVENSAQFRLIGRLPRTEPRGCSLSAEDLAARQKQMEKKS